MKIGYQGLEPYNDGVALRMMKAQDGRNQRVKHFLDEDEARQLRDDLNEALDD